jgi:transposase
MPFAALDLHKKIVEAVLLDEHGAPAWRGRFPATRPALEQFARAHLTPQHRIALEATTNTWAVVAILEPFVAEVVVSNPLRTRAIAEAKIKTDRVDALVLAQLLRSDFLPRVWTPDDATRRLRQSCTERANLVTDRTRLKNRIHSLLHQRLIEPPSGDLFQPSSRAWLAQLELDPLGRQALDRHLRQLVRLEEELTALTDSLAVQAHADARTRLLMTLPGVDFPVAQTLLAALGEIDRFPSADRAAAYLGLVPSTHQSAAHCYHGPITKQGSGHARWMLVQAAQTVAAHPGPLGVFFRRLQKKKNRNVAVVATARKLVTIAWHMLRRNEPYRYAQPSTLETKFSRLRIRATGQRRRTAPAKGTPRPAAYGTGKPTRAVPSLDQVCAAAQLAALPPAAPGELRMLDESGTAAFAQAIRKPKRVPRRSA